MPLYEYQCEACGHRFEKIQKFSDPPADSCPKCGGAVQKLIASPAFQFKGTGWYITDYAKKDGGGKDKSETNSDSKGDSKSESKSESKDAPAKDTSSKSDSGTSSSATPKGT